MGRKKNGSGQQVAILAREIARLKHELEQVTMRQAALSDTEKSIEQVDEEVEVTSSQSSDEESKPSEGERRRNRKIKGFRWLASLTRLEFAVLFGTDKSIEEAENEEKVQLHRAEKPWKPSTLTQMDDNDEGKGREERKKKSLLKTIRSLFDDDTQTTERKLTAKFLRLKVHESTALDDVASIIIDKAIDEPLYGPIYMRMCRAQVAKELKLNKNVSPLRSALLVRVQDTFTKKYLGHEAMKKCGLKQTRKQFSWRKLGNIKLLGQMYRYGMVSVGIIHSCVVDLLKEAFNKPNRYYPLNENIEGAMSLLEIRLKDGDVNRFPFDDCFQKLKEALPFVRIRTKFMIENLLKLRARGWRKPKGFKREPTTLEEIRVAIQRRKEQQNNQLKFKQARAARKAKNAVKSGI